MAKSKGTQAGRSNRAAVTKGSGASSAAASVSPGALTDRIVWICLHILVLLVPLAVSNPSVIGIDALPFTYDQFDIVKVFVMRALVLVGAAAWLWGLLRHGGRVRVTRTEWLVLAILAWLVLTSVFSIHPPTAVFGKYRRFEGLLSFMTYMGAFFLTLQLVDRPARIRSLARTLVVGGVLVSLYGVIQYLGLDPASWGRLPFEANRAFSTYGNPDLLGGYLIFPLAISLALAFSEREPRFRALFWGAFLIIAFCWLVAFVRGAWIGGVVALIAVGVAVARSKTRYTSVDWTFTGLVAAALGLATVRSLSSNNPVMNVAARITSIFKFGEGSANTRFQIWEAAIAAIRERPILGWGADTFRLLFPRFKPEAYTQTAGYLSVADNVHNYPLQLASAVGIPGLIMLYGLFIWTLASSAKAVFAKDSGPSRIVVAGFWAAVLGYVAHLLFGLSVTGSTIFLWVSMGVLLSPGAHVRDVRAPSWGVVPAVAIVLVCTLLFVGNGVYLAADHAYLNSKIGASGADAVAEAKRAVRLNPFNDMYRTEIGSAYQRQFELAVGSGDSASAGQYFTEAEHALQAVIDWTPMEYDNYVFLAHLYNQASFAYGDASYAQKAVAVAQEGIKVEPFGPAIRLQMAVAYMTLGQPQQALETAERAIQMDSDYPDLWTVLGDANGELGNLEAAHEAYQRVLNLEPGRTDTLERLKAVEASLSAEITAAP
ncbi:MAG TPA: O-antigen ligase family protein [Coriobacteriia bacterium]|nr:O-antigen ligase family protein [Coriobacteriia bacterium]